MDISKKEMMKYRNEKWYKAFKEVLTYFTLCSHSWLYRHAVSRRYRPLTDAEAEEMGRFIVQHVNDNEELACALIDRTTDSLSQSAYPAKPSQSLISLFFGAFFGLVTLTSSTEDQGSSMFISLFWIFLGLILLVIVFRQFPHRRIIENRSEEPGGMLRVLEEITRTM